MRKIRRYYIHIIAAIIIFAVGVNLGFFAKRIGLGKIKSLSAKPYVYQRDAELLRYAFTDKMVKSNLQVNPPVENITQLEQQINAYYVDASLFTNAYQELRIVNARRTDDLLRVDYLLADREYTAYAYIIPQANGQINRQDCCFIIPGSGKNQSTLILEQKSDLHNYRQLISGLKEKSDVFVLIKPNEDILAIHNGKNKLSQDFFIVHLINIGGSYSARYLIDSLAIARYLKDNYKRFALLGVSQGGQASLLNALQTNPASAVIASGYSIISDDIEYAGFNQLIIPNMQAYYNKEKVSSIMQSQDTRYLFSYGKQETSTYKIEAEDQPTCNFFKKLGNVECAVFNGGHEYPVASVDNFLNRFFYKENLPQK